MDAPERGASVVGPGGFPMTEDDLPPSSGKIRWTPLKKARIVSAVRGGLMDLSNVEERYGISSEEFCAWVAAINDGGIAALRTTRKSWEPNRG